MVQLNILIVGGSGFIGPHMVRTFQSRGHRVSVFNRGKRSANLPPGVEQLIGDRNSDLAALENRDWDGVIDLSAYAPAWVKRLGEAIKGRAKHYTFISTNAVYAAFDSANETNEESAVLNYEGEADPYTLLAPSGLHDYGALKVLCEREAERQHPSKVLVLRPGWVFGPGNSHPASIYWPARLARGGAVLVAGDQSTPVQFVDVRDLTEWCARVVEAQVTGVFNVVGPAIAHNLGQLQRALHAGVFSTASQTWVEAPWLAGRADASKWDKVLFWTEEKVGFAQMMRTSNARAVAHGFTARPLAQTLLDAYAWFCKQPAVVQAALFAQPPTKATDTSLDKAWDDYLSSEATVLTQWKSERGQRQ